MEDEAGYALGNDSWIDHGAEPVEEFSEHCVKMLQQICMHADVLRGLSGKSRRRRAKLLRGLVGKMAPVRGRGLRVGRGGGAFCRGAVALRLLRPCARAAAATRTALEELTSLCCHAPRGEAAGLVELVLALFSASGSRQAVLGFRLPPPPSPSGARLGRSRSGPNPSWSWWICMVRSFSRSLGCWGG
jgi:hypothetical protein